MNYQLELEKTLAGLQGTPRLLLHSCCAPCSSYVLESLAPHFAITVDYYNPNIYPAAEYERRAEEQRRFIDAQPHANPVALQAAPYEPDAFYNAVKGLEAIPEGGARCFACYALRLRHAAAMAKAGGYDFFASTLSISPHKNAAKLNELGAALAAEYGVAWLPNDFKKKNGFKRSGVLSAEYGLYRQDYCGCVFSLQESEARAAAKKAAE